MPRGVREAGVPAPEHFASSAAQNAGINGWDALKNKEKGRTTLADELNTVPATLPALMRAQKLQKRAVRCGVPEPEGTQAQQALQQAVDGWNAAQNADAAGSCCLQRPTPCGWPVWTPKRR